MSSGTGMVCPGKTVSLRVCAVGQRPEVPVLLLWGLLGERSADYIRLRCEIQVAVGRRLAAAPHPNGLVSGGAQLGIGDLGLVEMVGVWYRCRVVSRRGQHYRVFLLDEGCIVVTSAYYLAEGCKELFSLPPEVLGIVVADVVPSGGPRVAACEDVPVSTWTIEAMEFLSCLYGKEVSGVVQVVVTPQLIVLELPQLVTQMHYLGLARQVAPSCFSQVFRCCLTYGHLLNQLTPQLPACSHVTSEVSQLLGVLLSCQPTTPALDYFYPQLQLGVMEPVLVTHVSDPHHIYCRLQSLSQEIHCLSDAICHSCDQWEQDLLPRVGSPCAARGIDGQWYRALLLELVAGEQDQQVAVVIFVDYGRKETVTRENLRHLPLECFCVPVLTYACALQGISDGGCGWSPSQINELKALVLGKGVRALINAFSSFEHLYYVSLYGENGVNLNHLFGVRACCLVSQTEAQEQLEATAEELELPPGVPPVVLTRRDWASASVVDKRLKLGMFHKVHVSHIQDPSEFWLQLHEHFRLFRQLRQSMSNFYSHDRKLDVSGWDLQPGFLCCACGRDGAFYRAVITRVLDSGVEIHLVDTGSTETVEQCVVKELLPQFRELPPLALKCCLADASPLRGSWSESSVSAFRETVLNKRLKVHFLSVQGNKYSVEIFYQSKLGEESVSKLMAQGGYAKYQRCEIPETFQKLPNKAVNQASSSALAGKETQVNAEKRLREESDLKRCDRALNPQVSVMVREHPVAAIHKSKSTEYVSSQKYEGKENLPFSWRQNYVEMKPSSPYGGQLKVGSTVDVVVSYVENPSYFCCQLRRNNRDLELLMAEIQEYCKNSSHLHAWPNSVCLAQYSKDGKWYRALIIDEVPSAEKVEVMYVDYGNRELVSLTNLRSTNERFLRLKAQAFRCSLYNLIQAHGQDPLAWDEEAIQAFQEFVDTSSFHCELKCTIFALASINNKELFNIVDLTTPFQSACQFLTERGVARLSTQMPLISSVQLHSYYYSMHGLKIGSEEDIYITHVEDPCTFYCRLERCAGVLAQLTNSIDHLCEIATSLKSLHKSGGLCLAKYTDSHWYRAVILKSTPKIEVFFVDLGNTETIEKDNLLPLPSDACDILLLPMQAIKCSLSDVSCVPKEATMWFKQAVLERQLKAIIVGKESDGKLLIELFDGNTQINAKLKEKLSLINNTGLCWHVENETLCSRNTDVNERTETAESLLNAGRSLQRKKYRSEAHGGEESSKRHFKEDDVNHFQPARKGDQAAGLLKSDEMLSSKKDGFLLDKAGEEFLFSVQMEVHSDIKSDAEGRCIMLQNVSDLLQQKIVPALKVLVYVSHVNDLWDFYVQLESDEAQLNSISESLNNRTQAKKPYGQSFQAGDLISAVYSEDSLWYRAVVKEKTSDDLLSVQYIDYGNASVISVDQARRLPEDLSSIPAISIHCFLGGLQCRKNTDWSEKAVLYFTKRTSEGLLMCEFVQKVEEKWEVILSDRQGTIAVELADENVASWERSCSREILDRENSDITVCEPLPTQAQNEISCVSDCKSFIWKFPEAGQTVKIYVTVADGPEYFWSCSADTEVMNHIEEKIEETEHLGLTSLNNCRSCIKSGDICLAKYSQDGKFYRAKVISVKGDNVVVRHVDYGSEEAVSMEMVRQIPSELLKVPNQAFVCCLSGFSSSEGLWLSEAKEKFYDMTKDLLLEAEVIETRGDKASGVPLSVVKLEAFGKCINEEMKSFWKANKTTGDNVFSNLENPLEENRCSNNDMGLCLQRETTAICALAQEESESALLGSSSGDEMGTLVEEDQLQMYTSFDDLKEFILELEALPVESSVDEETKQALETESLEMQTALGSEAGEKALEQESFELPAVSEEMGELESLDFLDILSSLDERGNFVPSISDGEKTVELTSSDVQVSLGEKDKVELNLSGIHKEEVAQENWMEVESPSLRLSPSGGRLEKQLELETHDVLSVLSPEIEQLLELMLPVVQPSQEDAEEDSLGLKHAALQSSANSGSPFSFLREDLTNKRPAGTVESCDCEVEKHEWQKMKDDCDVEECMKQDLTDSLKQCRNTHLHSSDCKPGVEEVEKRHNENLADCSAEHNEYAYNLKGFAVGSKCVVWSSPKWCEACILEVSEKGTRVLNFSSGSEEIVDPENVWNGIPAWACRSPEAINPAAENLQSLAKQT